MPGPSVMVPAGLDSVVVPLHGPGELAVEAKAGAGLAGTPAPAPEE